MVPLLHFVSTFASTEESAGIGALGIDPIAIAAQAITFLLLFILLQKLALKKIVASLEQRRITINRGLHLSAEMEKQKADLDTKVEAALHEARAEADRIINEARVESGVIMKTAEDSASAKADSILRDAEARIERDIVAAKKALKTEVADLVGEVAGAILRDKMTESSDRKLVEAYLKEVL